MIRNMLRILFTYRFFLLKIIYYELIFIIKGYKGNKISFSQNSVMTDNIPSPYYFLYKIKKIISKYDFKTFIDLGCGSGRVIDFFNKSFSDKNFIGIEYYEEQYKYCKKYFIKNKNINLINSDFTKFNFLKYNSDCFFFNEPIKDQDTFIKALNAIINFKHRKNNILLIFLNCEKKILNDLNGIELVSSHYINENKGFSIYKIKTY